LIIGGGVAGITAALDLANAGQVVHLVEQNSHLGGQVSRLDKLYPTDHCAFCPLWTEIKKCRDHPRITVHTSAYVRELRQEGSHKRATIVERPLFIDEGACVFCGRCVRTCPVEKELGEPGDRGPSSHAIRITWDHACPPSYTINEDVCTKCGLCQEVCPTGAIDLNRTEGETILTVDEVIWATGFREVNLSGIEEFGMGTHPDIMSSTEF
jgi:heterodisulfide reductase subunit A